MDGNGNYYYKLFASYSGDGGRTWQPQIQLTTDFMWELSEFVYPQAVVLGTTLVVATQTDGETGTFVIWNSSVSNKLEVSVIYNDCIEGADTVTTSLSFYSNIQIKVCNSDVVFAVNCMLVAGVYDVQSSACFC